MTKSNNFFPMVFSFTFLNRTESLERQLYVTAGIATASSIFRSASSQSEEKSSPNVIW